MYKDVIITDIRVYLVETLAKGNLADSTRKVEKIGVAVIDVETNCGIRGVGLTYHEVGGEAVRSFILNAIRPRLIGKSPFETEVIYDDIVQYARGVGRKGLAFCAYSAVDIALWDIKGKLTGLPLCRMFGGNKDAVPVYGSGGWTSYTDDELVQEALNMLEAGYNKIKIKVGVEGGKNPRRDLKRVKAVREAVGSDVDIMLDANNVWTSAVAARFANEVKQYDILFLEEPVFADDIPGLSSYKRHTDVALATGEHEYTRYGVRDLILADACDYVQTDATRCGGFTELLKIGAMTQAWNLTLAPHGMEYIHMHVAAAFGNVPFVERLLIFEDVFKIAFPDAPVPEKGFIRIPDSAGLGLEADFDRIRANAV